MRLFKCEIFESKDSVRPSLQNVYAYVAWCEKPQSPDIWVGFFPMDKYVIYVNDDCLAGKKYLRTSDGLGGEIAITQRKIDSAGNLVIEFEGMGPFGTAALETCLVSHPPRDHGGLFSVQARQVIQQGSIEKVQSRT